MHCHTGSADRQREKENERERERERGRESIHSEKTTTLHMLHHFLWFHFSLSWEADLRYHCDWGAFLCWEMPHCVHRHWRNSPFLHRTLKPLRRHRISLCSCESTLHAFHTRTSFHLKSYSFLILSLLRSISSMDMLPKVCLAGSSIWCL